LVPRDEVRDAALLNGASVNVARAVGPALAGLLISVVGVGATFALNALSFVGVMLALLAWRRPPDRRPLGTEQLIDAIKAGVRYTRSAPEFQAVLGRSMLFIFFASALWSLLAVLARGPLRLGANGYGVLLASVGVGAVLGRVVVPRVRNRLTASRLVGAGSLAYGGALLAAAASTWVPLTVVVLLVAGVGWISVTSTVNAHAQLLLPNWTRARALAFMNVTFQGGQALGSVSWGALAGWLNVRAAFAVAGLGAVVGAVVGVRFLALRKLANVEPVNDWPEPHVDIEIDPAAGPVLVIVEWRIDPDRAKEFADVMRPVRRTRRRTGATRWGLFQDTGDPAVFVETFTVQSWSEHLRQHLERRTVAAQEVEARAREFLVTGQPPRVYHLLWAYRS